MHMRYLTQCRTSLLATAFLGLAGVPSMAAPSESFLAKIDKDQDQRISLDEFYETGPSPLHPRMRRTFESFDSQKSGKLTYDETKRVIDAVRGLQPKLAPEVDGSFADIPVDVHARSKRAYVKATVNGVEGSFLVDTGTSDTILDTDFAKRAGVDAVEICMTITGGNYGKKGDFVSFVKVPQMEIAGTRFSDFHAVMMDQSKPRSDFKGRLDGIIGGNILFAKPITLDYAKSRITYSQEGTRDAELVFDLLPKYEKVPVVDAEVDGVKFLLMFDSGAAIGDTLLINEPYQAPLRKLAGDDKANQYRSKEVRVAGKLLVSDKVCLLRPFEHSVIGSPFFARGLITVDKQARKIRIKANPPS